MQFSEQQFLLEDQAFLLASRGVVRLQGGRAAQALQPLLSISLDKIYQNKVSNKAALAHVLDDGGFLMIDCFVVNYLDDLLIECDKSLIATLLQLLAPHCEDLDVSAQDVSAEWSVFAHLPDQNIFDDGSEFIKYVDPRWHMGVRVLRPANTIRSSQWGSEIKWASHALKLGFLPSVSLLQGISVSSREAGLHAMNLPGNNCGLEALSSVEQSSFIHSIERRLLPMRVEPNSLSFPTMAGGVPVWAGEGEIGKAIAHHGLFALALVNLKLWREALGSGTPLHCGGQTVLITWPSWLAQESCGRGGPVAMSN